jgi:phage shock protein A
MSRRNTDALVEVLATKKKSYEEQIDLLKTQHEKEIFERDKLIEQYHDLIAKIEAKYKEKEKQLSKKEKVRIKQIIKKSKGDADVIKKEIEESFGFTFVD